MSVNNEIETRGLTDTLMMSGCSGRVNKIRKTNNSKLNQTVGEKINLTSKHEARYISKKSNK